MAGEWETARLSQLCEQIADCPHSTPLWTDSGVIVLRNQNIRDGRLDLSSPSYTDEAHFEQRSRRARLKSGDLVLTREAPMGEVCMIPENLRCCLGQRMVMLRPDPKKCDSRFLLYSIQSDTVQHEIKVNEGTGSTVSNLRIPLLEALPIPFPPLAEQKAIAAVLGALDDKIELNRRMNAKLEAMARALFQSWFVDFDPVRAKLDGREPVGLDPGSVALFPDSFQDSQLGHIPAGWAANRVEEVASRIAMGPFGSRITRDNFVPDGVPVVRGGNLTNGFIDNEFVFLTEGKADELKASVARPLDIVFTHRGTLGQVGIIPISARYPRYVVSQSQMLLSVDREKLSPWAAYLFFSSPQGEAALLANTSTTGVPSISRPTTSLKAISIIVPPIAVSKQFEELVQPLFLQREHLAHQSRTLATLRDTLLPKLLSGELSVGELKPITEVAA